MRNAIVRGANPSPRAKPREKCRIPQYDITKFMRRVLLVIALLAAPLLGQQKRVWVLRAPGEMVEYDPATFAPKQTVKVPSEAVSVPQSVEVNHAGQILFAPAVTLPLAEGDAESAHKAWFWNGRTAATFDLGAKRDVGSAGSNQAITELAPAVYTSGGGGVRGGRALVLVREPVAPVGA